MQITRTVDMNKCVWWEQVSAAIDGELSDAQRGAALTHATGCFRCSQTMKVAAALPAHRPSSANTPDGTTLTASERRWLSGRWARRFLLLAAIAIIIEAVPDYIREHGIGTEPHAARYVATWQISFGVGLLLAAWVSRLTHAMLALAATYGVLTFIASAVDVVGGHGEWWREAVHVIELIGVFLLWRITPSHLLPWRPSSRRSGSHRRTPGPDNHKQPLRLAPSDPTETEHLHP